MNNNSCCKLLLRNFLLILLVALLSACAPRASKFPKRNSNYKVSVSSGGHKVSNYNQPLVHYVALTPERINTLKRTWMAHSGSYLHSRVESDPAGYAKGLRIVASSAKSLETQLGFRIGDLVTAVNREHMKGPQDLQALFNTLATGKKASITLMRDGRPHKIFYRRETSS